jgi:nitrogen fixation NifU-like protein
MTGNTMYSAKVMANFRNPEHMGEMKDADGVGRVGNPICGDVMHMFIKVAKGKGGRERITDVRFQTFGCVAAIATSNMTAELARGKTLEEAMKLGRKDVADALEGLPPIKMHCSNLASDALHAAIKDYYKRKGKSNESKKGKGSG